MSDTLSLKQMKGFKEVVARLLKAGWITDKNAVLSDGETCTLAIDEFTSLGRKRMSPIGDLLKPAFPKEFVGYLGSNGTGDYSAMLKQWLESADWSKMAGVWPKYESLITDLQPPAFSPFETMALMGIALVFAPDGQPSQTRLP